MALPRGLPAKNTPPTPATIEAARSALTGVMANHAGAEQPWTFYEVVDEWIGPWGNAGYPIGYGKYYCQAFWTNEKLRRNTTTRAWVWRTMIALQESLRDFLVRQYAAGRLARISEAEVRAAAFASHASAYDRGGLTLVALIAPELIPTIASIPSREFDPRGANFWPTVDQVLESLGFGVHRAMAVGLASLMPAHSGFLSNAYRADQRRMAEIRNRMGTIARVRSQLEAGRLDRVSVLNAVTARLLSIPFPDRQMARVARDLIADCNARKRVIASRYRRELQVHPEWRANYNRVDPGWSEW
ncbi:MAG: hypothetical protein D6695_10975 [Planctomycetota bacterium]|nr:MAG: hypothetical protein D6695_10975 [Planctomycetota bacterium]